MHFSEDKLSGPGSPSGASGSADFRVERLSGGNLPDLGLLDKAVYGVDRPGYSFQKKYATAYTGAQYLGYLAYNGQNEPVAYYGVMPCRLQYKDRILLAAQSGDTMTHPAYRNKGLFVKLCQLTVELCRREGVKLLFGFPNQHSYPGLVNKLGWTTTGAMECFCVSVAAVPLAALSSRFTFLKRSYLAWCTARRKGRLLPLRGVPSSAVDATSGGVYRDDAYLNYKTYSSTQVIRIGKAKAWIRIGQDLVLGDLSLEGQDFGETIVALKKIAAGLGLRRIYFHSSTGTPLHRLFAARYPVTPSFPVIFRDLDSGIPLEQLKFTFADIDIF